MATEEHTTRQGTYITSIVKALNAHQPASVFEDKDGGARASDYMSMVVADVHYSHHGLINNVLTRSLSFWGGHRAMHYDVSYGYDLSNGGSVAMAEEYDPTRFSYSLRGYGNQNPLWISSSGASPERLDGGQAKPDRACRLVVSPSGSLL